MEYYCLASGSKGNCFIIRSHNTTLMIDCGCTKKYLMECFKKIDVKISDINGILITHDHSDHISGIKAFKDLDIFSSNTLKDVNVHLIKPFTVFEIGDFKIFPIALSHDAPSTMGYLLFDGEERLLYMTDTGYVNGNYYKYFKDLDYIIIESNHDVEMLMNTQRPLYVKRRIYSDSGHLCNEDCAEILGRILCEKTKHVWLAHISQEANTPDKAFEVNMAYLSEKNIDVSNCSFVALKQFEIVHGGCL